MPHLKKRKKAGRCVEVTNYFGSQLSSTCSEGQCSMPAPNDTPSIATSQFTFLEKKSQKELPRHTNSSQENLDASQTLSDFFNHHIDQAKNNMGYAFLLALPEAGITKLLEDNEFKGHHFSEEEIYWINQAFKAFALLGLAGTSPHQTLAAPAVTFLLTKCLNVFGTDKKIAGYLATAMTLAGMAVYLGPTVMAVGMGAGIAGKTLAKESIFAVKKVAHATVEFVSGYMPAVFSGW